MVEFDECTGKTSRRLDGTLKNWTHSVFVKTAHELIFRKDDKRSKVFSALQGQFGSHWLNVVPCKNLGLKLDDQQLQASIDLRLGANICVATVVKELNETVYTVFLVPRVLVSSHVMLLSRL